METRTVRYGIFGSLAVHALLLCFAAFWIGYPTLKRIVDTAVVTEKEVTLIFPTDVELAPAIPPAPVVPASTPPVPKPKEQPYIRTTQNTEAATAPTKTDFISDKNTVASSKLASTAGGDPTMPTTKGIDYQTKELANRTYKDGEIKNDSAPAMNQPPVPAVPEVKPTPDPMVAKKQDSPTEVKMKELDEVLLKEATGPKVMPAEKPPEPPPLEEAAKVEPIAKKTEPPKPALMPLINTPKPDANAFQPETHTSNKKGGIDAIGSEDAVNAKATTMGAYRRQATGAVEKKWHALIRMKLDVVEPGNLTVRFYVNKYGKVEDARITNNRASPLLADVTLEAILMAEIPPIPKELLPVLDRERMEINYDVVIHP